MLLQCLLILSKTSAVLKTSKFPEVGKKVVPVHAAFVVVEDEDGDELGEGDPPSEGDLFPPMLRSTTRLSSQSSSSATSDFVSCITDVDGGGIIFFRLRSTGSTWILSTEAMTFFVGTVDFLLFAPTPVLKTGVMVTDAVFACIRSIFTTVCINDGFGLYPVTSSHFGRRSHTEFFSPSSSSFSFPRCVCARRFFFSSVSAPPPPSSPLLHTHTAVDVSKASRRCSSLLLLLPMLLLLLLHTHNTHPGNNNSNNNLGVSAAAAFVFSITTAPPQPLVVFL